MGTKKAVQVVKPVKQAVSQRNDFNGKSKAIFGKRKRNGEEDTMALLDNFKSKLHDMKSNGSKEIKETASTRCCVLHGLENCGSCGVVSDTESDLGDWMGSQLVFKKRGANVYEPKIDDYLFIDPRNATLE